MKLHIQGAWQNAHKFIRQLTHDSNNSNSNSSSNTNNNNDNDDNNNNTEKQKEPLILPARMV